MAKRNVVIGWNQGDNTTRILEVSPNDAGALIDSGMCRVNLGIRDGELANATELEFRHDYLVAIGYSDSEKRAYLRDAVLQEAWRQLLNLPRHPKHDYTIIPIQNL